MELDRFLSDPVSRRRFFAMSGVSVAGGSVAFLSACGDSDDQESEVAGDIAILNDALNLEFTAAAAYEASAPFLKGDLKPVGRTLLDQEQQHAAALTSAIKDIGGTPEVPKSTYDFPSLRNQKEALTFSSELENKIVAAYIDAAPKLSAGDLRRSVYTIVANEAEHISVLLGALKEPQVPDAFVTGAIS
jgi:bacterioferritin (cytochrome b1)